MRNVSVMVPGPNFAWMAKQLARLSGIEIGLHVTLNCEWPSLKFLPTLPPRQIPSLLDSGGALLQTPQNLYERPAALPELVAEAEAQLERARANDLRIDYLDEHMGVGWLPGLKNELRSVARRESLVYADDLPHIIELEQAASDGTGFLDALSKSSSKRGLVVLHPAMAGESLRNLSLPANPSEIDRRISEGALFGNPLFVQACREGGVEPVTASELAAGSDKN